MAGGSTEKPKPQRQCIGCGERHDKKDLIRIVLTPEGKLIADATGRAQGRGAYICPRPECLQLALKKKGLNRSFKRQFSQEETAAVTENFSRICASREGGGHDGT
ncbi:MAG: YlxR family protein [Lachnospiraceae bacterium]|nr:YlxR family protein [Lachnospiraceae bacterium]